MRTKDDRMQFLGEILVEHKWVVLVAALLVFVGVVAGANRWAYEQYVSASPSIRWENVPESAFTIFFSNMRNTLLSLSVIGVLFPWPLASGLGLGISLGVGFWIISQNPAAIIVFSYGILELYSVFLALVGGFLVLSKIGEAIIDFFGFFPTSHKVNWKKVAEEYGSIFYFSVIGLFVSAWMEAFYAHMLLFSSFLFLPVTVAITSISIVFVSYVSFSSVRTFIHSMVSPRATYEKALEVEKLPNGVWCVCPGCGAYISADIRRCTCGVRLPEKPKSQSPRAKIVPVETREEKILEAEKLPKGVWCKCPVCSRQIRPTDKIL